MLLMVGNLHDTLLYDIKGVTRVDDVGLVWFSPFSIDTLESQTKGHGGIGTEI